MKYGRMFASGFVGTTVSTAAKELLHVLCSSSHVVAVHEVAITGRSTSSEFMTVGIAFAGTTAGVGSTLALTPLVQGQTACSGNVYGVATTNATGLTYVYKETVNVLNGFHWIPTPECRPIIKPGGRLVVRRETVTTATDYAVDAHIVFEEIG